MLSADVIADICYDPLFDEDEVAEIRVMDQEDTYTLMRVVDRSGQVFMIEVREVRK